MQSSVSAFDAADLDGLDAFHADGAAGLGNVLEALGHAAEDVARCPAERPENAAAVIVEHADFPELVGQPLHQVRRLIEPQALARDRETGLVFGGNAARIEILRLLREAGHDLGASEHGMGSGHADGLGERVPDRLAGHRRIVPIGLDDATDILFNKGQVETLRCHETGSQYHDRVIATAVIVNWILKLLRAVPVVQSLFSIYAIKIIYQKCRYQTHAFAGSIDAQKPDAVSFARDTTRSINTPPGVG
ncbi:hypothetical protein CHELA20_50140 [Hyphomicrobiales bacterium]|nr:hypothetical protein CHELA41_20230 [Hyphomicrobiales bacterium]CAH1666966.1 hypothetical protein CHELA20_50140 [Hyphomicrobiales bacterium]